jgi:uncharacterized membrane protein
MANNIVIALHAGGATVALTLGAYTLIRRTRGDRAHRWVGRVWVVAMYWTILSSFTIKELRPGHFSWIHGLSAFTFGTLSIGLWAAVTHRVRWHRSFMTGSYFGLVGAFVGAVVVPARKIPQWTVHHPAGLALGAAACLLTAAAVIALSRRPAPAPKRQTIPAMPSPTKAKPRSEPKPAPAKPSPAWSEPLRSQGGQELVQTYGQVPHPDAGGVPDGVDDGRR